MKSLSEDPDGCCLLGVSLSLESHSQEGMTWLVYDQCPPGSGGREAPPGCRMNKTLYAFGLSDSDEWMDGHDGLYPQDSLTHVTNHDYVKSFSFTGTPVRKALLQAGLVSERSECLPAV